MNKPTILFVLGNYEYGGVVTVAKKHSQVLSKKYNLVILGWRGNIEYPKKYFPYAKVYMIERGERANLLGRVQDFFPFIKKLMLILKSYNVDVINYHLTWTSFYVLLAPGVWRVKKIATFHGAYDLESEDYVGKNIFSKIVTVLVRKNLQHLTLKMSNVILVLSDYSCELISKHYSKDLLKKTKIVQGFVS